MSLKSVLLVWELSNSHVYWDIGSTSSSSVLWGHIQGCAFGQFPDDMSNNKAMRFFKRIIFIIVKDTWSLWTKEVLLCRKCVLSWNSAYVMQHWLSTNVFERRGGYIFPTFRNCLHFHIDHDGVTFYNRRKRK